MKGFVRKLASIIAVVYGYGIMLSLFIGGLTFFGYLVAIVIGGDLAARICVFLYKGVLPVVIYASTVTVVLGLLKMYLSGEIALAVSMKEGK